MLLTNESNAFFGQQQKFFSENQHVAPSPLLLCAVLKHPSGHEFPIKQNGAMPYHLHNAFVEIGARINRKRKTKDVLKSIDEPIIIDSVVVCMKRKKTENMPILTFLTSYI